MSRSIRGSLLLVPALLAGINGAEAQSTTDVLPKADSMETDVKNIKEALLGNWESIAPEVRPSKNPDGSLKPFYLKRAFKYLPSNRFELDVVNSADPYGAVPLAKIRIVGHMFWQGPHPIALGAQKVDFVADEAYEVTPLAQGFADVLNKVASAGYSPWAVNSSQSIFGKSFAPFGLKEGTNFMEYDLVYVRGDLLSLGSPQYRRAWFRHGAEPSDEFAYSVDPEIVQSARTPRLVRRFVPWLALHRTGFLLNRTERLL